jgi:FixJ family two-component response regulator
MSSSSRFQQSASESVVFVIDDDVSVRESVELAFRREGRQVRTFASVAEFLAQPPLLIPSCLLLGVSLPDFSGFELMSTLADRIAMPVIFMTAHYDVPMVVQAVKAGAFEFVTKPFAVGALLNVVRQALECSRTKVLEQAELQALRARYESLRRREREVLALVVSGLLNKQISGELGILEITVKHHRGKMIEKMGAGSLPELVRIAAKLRLPAAPGKREQTDRSPSVRPFLRPCLGEGHTAYALAGP